MILGILPAALLPIVGLVVGIVGLVLGLTAKGDIALASACPAVAASSPPTTEAAT